MSAFLGGVPLEPPVTPQRPARVSGLGVPNFASGPPPEKRPFTPHVLSSQQCMARTWGSGHGAQCGNQRLEGSDLCRKHHFQAATPGGLPHGRCDGPVPPAKMRDFHRAASGSNFSAEGRSSRSRLLNGREGALKRRRLGAASQESVHTDIDSLHAAAKSRRPPAHSERLLADGRVWTAAAMAAAADECPVPSESAASSRSQPSSSAAGRGEPWASLAGASLARLNAKRGTPAPMELSTGAVQAIRLGAEAWFSSLLRRAEASGSRRSGLGDEASSGVASAPQTTPQDATSASASASLGAAFAAPAALLADEEAFEAEEPAKRADLAKQGLFTRRRRRRVREGGTLTRAWEMWSRSIRKRQRIRRAGRAELRAVLENAGAARAAGGAGETLRLPEAVRRAALTALGPRSAGPEPGAV
eukprot:TRINITY_DN13105_c2_g1_i2.p1 TRINITY_DN13105_c2_g1~~TRINITY_DN13105_c2_g1_i2.p1  ORF type:complete len:417 (+),score=60.40 TRINITY_DN13105_c2_g1_i2:799-2049(+)